MTTTDDCRWRTFGEDRPPTDDDLPFVVQRVDRTGTTGRFVATLLPIPTMSAGDRWCPLPPMPEPSPASAVINGERWRIVGDEVQRRLSSGTWITTLLTAGELVFYGRLAQALGVVDAWPAFRPMSDLASGHKARVLIRYGVGELHSVGGTFREDDEFFERVAWCPIPDDATAAEWPVR